MPVPIVVPDVRVDYDASSQVFTGIKTSNESVLFRFYRNSCLGVDFFGTFGPNIVPFLDFLSPSGVDVTTDTPEVHRALSGVSVNTVEVLDPGIFGSYDILEININGYNILAHPINLTGPVFTAGVLKEVPTNIPKNSNLQVVSNSALQASIFVKFTGINSGD